MPVLSPLVHGRSAGALVPLFSIPSTRSWGIGELGDLAAFASWCHRAAIGVLQVLPLNEMAAWSQSPYSAMSSMAIDPIYLGVHAIEDFVEIGGVAAMPAGWRDRLAAARRSRTIDYRLVRGLKDEACRVAFGRFRDDHWRRASARAVRMRAWVDEQRWWLDDYALFRAIHASRGEASWRDWPDALRDRDPAALAEARHELNDERLYRQYLQWVASEQWAGARAAARPLAVFGDLPFMVDADSADVWARPSEFRLDASVGAPPDAFSADGQDWGLPPCDWTAMADNGFSWIADRARRSGDLYDGFRIDHLVGFYRTYTIPAGKAPRYFSPRDEADQLALGETLVRLLAGTRARVIAEDLGTVPDFVRASLGRLGVPGFRVLRWEREWHVDGRPFRDPAGYPAASVATTGTHDTDTLACWWDQQSPADRAAVGRIPGLRRALGDDFPFATATFSDRVRDALLEVLFHSGSDLLILPLQDIFGWRDRVNVPASVAESNWTWQVQWPSDVLPEVAEAQERARVVSLLAAESGRTATA